VCVVFVCTDFVGFGQYDACRICSSGILQICVEGCTCIQETLLVQASYPLIPNVRGGGKDSWKRERTAQWLVLVTILFATPNGRGGGKELLEEGRSEQHCDWCWSLYCLPFPMVEAEGRSEQHCDWCWSLYLPPTCSRTL
jgi:hypothetical protein